MLVRQHGSADTRLRRALAVQTRDAAPWLHAHLLDMLKRIDAGLAGPEIFGTGLLEPDTWCAMADADRRAGHGSRAGAGASARRARLLARVRRQAAVLRWSLLISSVSACWASRSGTTA